MPAILKGLNLTYSSEIRLSIDARTILYPRFVLLYIRKGFPKGILSPGASLVETVFPRQGKYME